MEYETTSREIQYLSQRRGTERKEYNKQINKKNEMQSAHGIQDYLYKGQMIQWIQWIQWPIRGSRLWLQAPERHHQHSPPVSPWHFTDDDKVGQWIKLDNVPMIEVFRPVDGSRRREPKAYLSVSPVAYQALTCTSNSPLHESQDFVQKTLW